MKKTTSEQHALLTVTLLFILFNYSDTAASEPYSFDPNWYTSVPYNERGEPDKTKSITTGDPINGKTRTYYFQVPLFDLGGPISVNFGMSYESDNKYQYGRFGPMISEVRRYDETSVNFLSWKDGTQQLSFHKLETGEWRAGALSDYRYQLKEVTGANGWFYLMDPADQSIYLFEKDGYADDSGNQGGRLRYHLDRNGNRVNYTYGCSGGQYCYPTSITDSLGRQLSFTPTYKLGDLTQVIVSDGTRIFTIGYTSGEEVSYIQDPLGNTTTYQRPNPNSGIIISQTRPQGNTPYTQSYLGSYDGRVANQTDAYANTTTLSKENIYQTNEARPDGSNMSYIHDNLGLGCASPISYTDAQGNTATFSVDVGDRTTAITDRLGDTTSVNYDNDTNYVTSITNAKGDTLSHSYSSQNQTFTNPATNDTFIFTFYNRTRTNYPDGTFETFAYDNKGNLETFINRNSKQTTYTYNSQGLVLTRINAAGGITTYTYNADGTLASSTDSGVDPTLYAYDAFKRLITIDPPGIGQIDITYDATDRVTSITDENSHSYQYQYDKNGNLTQVSDPANKIIQYEYDLMDRVNQITSRTNGISNISYNYHNKVSSRTDANAIQTDYSYNNRHWLQSVTRNGKTTTLAQDDEGVDSGSTSPAGRSLQQQTNKLGHLTAIIQPGGETTQLAHDKMTRLISVTDPLNRQTQYAYDNIGSLTQVTLPGGSSTTYTRNALGQLTHINDLNSKEWVFEYTNMGRLKKITDPLNRQTNYTHDNRGRIGSITYQDAVNQTLTYDDVGNITRRLFNDGVDLTFSYDALNNLTATNNLTLTRNDSERITSSSYNGHTFGATYDAGGRVATATYGGVFTVNYSYNADNRLSRVSDTLGNQVDLSYDADGNLTGLNRSNGLNAIYSWDNNARLSRIQDGTMIDIQYSYDAAGQFIKISSNVPLEPSSLLNSGSNNFSVDTAGQTNTAGYTFDARGRIVQSPGHTFSWVGDDLMVRMDDVNFTYNGLAEIISRTEDGTTTHYHHNHALGFNPIVAEQQGAGFTRYYVYTPDGQLLYSLDPQNNNAVAFYHRDQIGSTLALTNDAGTITDSYAYTPYGEMLGHAGSSNQPYTFVGTLGVRQEDDLYQMRQRYYDSVTARFLSKEPVWPQIDSPAMINPYQYVEAQPLQRVDLTGLDSENIEIGVKIGFHKKYIDKLHKKFTYDQLVKTNKNIKEIIEKEGRKQGWSRRKINQKLFANLNELLYFQKAMELRSKDPLELNAQLVNDNGPGKFVGKPRWFIEAGGKKILIGKGDKLAMSPEQVKNLFKLSDHKQLVRIELEAEYISDGAYSDTFGTSIDVTYGGK